jgi:hypothetical protein
MPAVAGLFHTTISRTGNSSRPIVSMEQVAGPRIIAVLAKIQEYQPWHQIRNWKPDRKLLPAIAIWPIGQAKM